MAAGPADSGFEASNQPARNNQLKSALEITPVVNRTGSSPLPGLLLLMIPFLALIHPASGRAQEARTSQEMLQFGIENLRTSRDKLLPTVTDAGTALAAIRTMHDQRRLAHRVIAMDHPLDDFVGIVMADRYDDEYLCVVDSLVTRFESLDRDLPSEEATALLRDGVGTLPPVSGSSSPFVIAYIIGKVAPGATKLPQDTPPELREDAAEAAVRLIGGLTEVYRKTSAKREASDSWHESVIERLRCPDHKCSYRTVELRNGLRADGSLYRRYLVECESGKEVRPLDFDLGEMGVLSQSKGRQNLTSPIPPATRRQPGVE